MKVTGNHDAQGTCCRALRTLGCAGQPRMIVHRVPLLLVLGSLVAPQLAWANAGTPLMIAGELHLLFGNAVIGLGEGLLLAWLFKVPIGRSIIVMIIANYVSAWIGLTAIVPRIMESLKLDLYNARFWFWILVGLAYVITIVIEWPFIAWCLRKHAHWVGRSLLASLVLQSASYLLLCGWYGMATSTTVYRNTHLVPPEELTFPAHTVVYYIAARDGNAYGRNLATGWEDRVYDLQSTHSWDRLLVRTAGKDGGPMDLVALMSTKAGQPHHLVTLLTNLHVSAAPRWYKGMEDTTQDEDTYFNFGDVIGMGDMAQCKWTFSTGFWARQGMSAINEATKEQIHFAYNTPFGSWDVRNAVQLPNDLVIFQFGEDQICAFDPANRKLALLCRGRGPVPVIGQVPTPVVPASTAAVPGSAAAVSPTTLQPTP